MTLKDYGKCSEMVLAALQKQIPMKPLHIHKNYYCPICKEDGWMIWDDAIPNDFDAYCGKCGQAIDWFGIEDTEQDYEHINQLLQKREE